MENTTETRGERVMKGIYSGDTLVCRLLADPADRDKDILRAAKLLRKKMGKTLPKNARVVHLQGQ